MAKLIVSRDYQSKKNKGNIVGYKINLSKSGVEKESQLNEKDELEIEYKKNMIVITKK